MTINHGHLVRGFHVVDARDNFVELLFGLSVEVATHYDGPAVWVGGLEFGDELGKGVCLLPPEGSYTYHVHNFFSC